MPVLAMLALLLVMAVGSLVFSTLTYALRDLSRVRLGEYLERRKKSQWFDVTADHAEDLILSTAIWRMIFNTGIVVLSLMIFEGMGTNRAGTYVSATIMAGIVTLFVSIALPHSISQYGAAEVVGSSARFLYGLRVFMSPVTLVLHQIDDLVRRAAGASEKVEPEQIEQEILSVVEEGEKEGIVDEQEREMIESVIEFRETTAGQIMTPRTKVVAIESDATLEHIRQTIEESGHSRLPVYKGSLDQVVGVLYARDLLQFLGQKTFRFDLVTAMRPPLYVPESKPSRELLKDFRLQKIHIAIVLDEYGGTAGLVTIEDILEQIVGDITDEHEPVEEAMFKRISETLSDADAAIEVAELNRLTGLNLPEDADYTTLGGYLTTAIGSIPTVGVIYEHDGVKFTITSAEPQKINRVRIEQSLQTADEVASAE